MIAIKKLTEQDELSFQEFLKNERMVLPKLNLAPMPYPHEEVAVLHHLDSENILDFTVENGLTVTAVSHENIIVSRHSVNVLSGGGRGIFWVYIKRGATDLWCRRVRTIRPKCGRYK